MSESKAIITIDATDGLERFFRQEPIIEHEDDVARLVLEEGNTTGEAGWMTVAARSVGIVPDHVLKSDRMLLYSAARANVNSIIRKYREEFEAPDGKTYEMRSYVGEPKGPPGETRGRRRTSTRQANPLWGRVRRNPVTPKRQASVAWSLLPITSSLR